MSEDAKPATLATQKPTQNWFASWFDTPYYHILYKERNYREAQIFMDNLTHYLNLPEKAKVLDLACGKGRHAIYLNQLGFEVIGADLSENSIAEASKIATVVCSFKCMICAKNSTINLTLFSICLPVLVISKMMPTI